MSVHGWVVGTNGIAVPPMYLHAMRAAPNTLA